MWAKYDRIRKNKNEKLEYCAVIPLLILLGVNQCLSLLHMSNFYINSIEKRNNTFEIGYMVNPTLNVEKLSIDQVEKFLKETFHSSNMSGIKMYWRRMRICVVFH